MNFYEIRVDVRRRLSDAPTSSFFTEDDFKRYVNEAYQYIAAMHEWPQTERIFYKNTEAGVETYSYPNITGGVDFYSDGIYSCYVDNKEHKRLDYDSYRLHKQEDPNSTALYFSDWGRTLFLYPVPTSVVEIKCAGRAKPIDLIEDTDKTLFSDSEPTLDEAIVKRVLWICLDNAARVKEARQQLIESEEIINVIWKRISDRKAKYKSTRQFYDVPNFFPQTGQFAAGNFE